MKVNVNRESLLKAVKTVDSIVQAKNTSNVLSLCYFYITKDNIEISTTNNEISMTTNINAVSDNEGSFLIDGKKLSNILSELNDIDIDIEVNENYILKIKAQSTKGKYKLIGMEPSEYPQLPDADYTESIELDQSMLKQIIKKVYYAASLDGIKPIFNAIYFKKEKTNLIAVTTDSRRLAIIKEIVAGFVDFDFILPLKTAGELVKNLDNGSCKIVVDGNQFFIKINETEIISRLVDGQYPNYNSIIPSEKKYKVIVDRNKFFDSIKRAMIFTIQPANKIIMTFGSGVLKIKADTPELGQSSEEIEIESNIEIEINIGMNCQFLIDSLKEIDSELIELTINGEMAPVVISEKDNDNYMSIVMPIQIKKQEG